MVFFGLSSFIDWDFTFALPLQKAATFPKLLENVPGGAPPNLPDSVAYLDFSADKAYFLSVFETKERQRSGGPTPITKLIETSSERNFFELSHHRPAVRKEFVRRYCAHTFENLSAALEQLDCFLARDEEFGAGHEGVVEVLRELGELRKEYNAEQKQES
jgi:hypothetical protein